MNDREILACLQALGWEEHYLNKPYVKLYRFRVPTSSESEWEYFYLERPKKNDHTKSNAKLLLHPRFLNWRKDFEMLSGVKTGGTRGNPILKNANMRDFPMGKGNTGNDIPECFPLSFNSIDALTKAIEVIADNANFISGAASLKKNDANMADISELSDAGHGSEEVSESSSQKSISSMISREVGSEPDSNENNDAIPDLKVAMRLTAKRIDEEYRNKPGEDVDAVVKRRVGQSQFRALLGSIYGVACHISGLPKERLLIASHIVPWSKATGEEKTDPDNGLLLAVNWDAVFDKGFICFDEEGNVIFSEELDEETVRLLGIDANVRLREDLLTPNRLSYLQRHREEIFERWKK